MNGVDPKNQFSAVEKSRDQEAMQRREAELRERRRLDMQVQDAEAEEKRQKEERRMQLKAVTEQDRVMKQQFRSSVQAPTESQENVMSKVFARPTHQAYERRAKQE